MKRTVALCIEKNKFKKENVIVFLKVNICDHIVLIISKIGCACYDAIGRTSIEISLYWSII